MNIQKRNEYEKKMTLNGIDTLSGYVSQKISENDMKNGVKCNVNQCNYQIAKERTYLLINPNKQGKSEKLKIVNENDQMVLTVETNANMTLEFGLFDRHSTFFEEVFNIKPVLRQKKSNI